MSEEESEFWDDSVARTVERAWPGEEETEEVDWREEEDGEQVPYLAKLSQESQESVPNQENMYQDVDLYNTPLLSPSTSPPPAEAEHSTFKEADDGAGAPDEAPKVQDWLESLEEPLDVPFEARKSRRERRKERKPKTTTEVASVFYSFIMEGGKEHVVRFEEEMLEELMEEESRGSEEGGPSKTSTPKTATEAEGATPLESYTMYKPVGKKVLPVAEAFGQEQTTKLHRPPLSRDPYQTPLTAHPPEFVPGGRLTEERIAKIDFGPEGWLRPAEKNLILHVLRLREKALAGSAEERGKLKPTWADPVKAATVPHKPWKEKPIPLPAALRDQITELVKERIATGLYEPSTSAYSGRWFVVKKKNGKLRIVHDLQPLNGVTIRNSGNPPVAEEFIESFAGRQSYALMDILGGYDEFPIDESFRDMTTFQTLLGPHRLARLPQGWTNSVQEFQRMMEHIFREEIPEYLGVFIDDCGMKGAESDYGGEEIEGGEGIRRLVWEHAVRLERMLFRLEEAGLTASIEKLQAITPVAEILGVRVSKEGTSITEAKQNKISRFPRPTNAHEARSWLGLLTYVRHYIVDFGNLVRPIRELTKKDAEFVWTEHCESSFTRCKKLVGESILLAKLDYTKGRGDIILSVDSSNIAAGGALWQERRTDKRRDPVRYESITFTETESKYSQPKLELAGVVKMLKKLKRLLWGVHFILEVDAAFLVQMINNPDLPNAAMTRWLAYIHLFDFEIRHVPGKKHTFVDVLSRVRRTESDDSAESVGELMSNMVIVEKKEEGSRIVGMYLAEGEYEGQWKELGEYLEAGTRPEGMDEQAYRRAQVRAARFFVKNGRLYRRQKDGQHQEVIMKEERRQHFLSAIHDDGGHRGRDETYRQVKLRAWWPGLEKDIRRYVKSCDLCQRQNPVQEREKSAITLPAGLFSKIHFDCVHLRQGLYFISARDDLSGWVEARILRNLKSKTCAKFVEEEVISRYAQFGQATVDGGSEFKKEFREVLEKAGIPVKVIAPYHPEANGRAERGHAPIVNLLAKLCRTYEQVSKILPKVLAADRISTSRSTGYSPFELVFGVRPVLPIDMEEMTWLAADWEGVKTRKDLLESRVAVMERKEELVEEAKRKMRKAREASVAYLDKVNAHRIRPALEEGQLVLVLNQLKHDTHTQKLSPCWHGPYRVVTRLTKGSYVLAELDGAVIARAYASKRLRRYHHRGRPMEELQAEEEAELEEEEEGRETSEEDEEEAKELARRQNELNERTRQAKRRFLGVYIPTPPRGRLPSASTSKRAIPSSLSDDSPDRGSMN